jgi:hypothetical protein
METLDELSKTTNGKIGFFKHVFNFNNESKNEMMNIIQYAVLALIPIVIINKLMQRYVPEADDEKGSPEILAEIIVQVIIMFLGILLVHRIITYVPTYSGDKYADFSVTNIILAVLVIVLSLQTKLGEKVSILVDRTLDLWNGSHDKNKSKGKTNIKVSQPIVQGQNQVLMTSAPSMGTTSISDLPQVQQQLPNYDAMYRQDTTPLVGAATPGVSMSQQESFEPMAANSALGGGSFGGAFNW